MTRQTTERELALSAQDKPQAVAQDKPRAVAQDKPQAVAQDKPRAVIHRMTRRCFGWDYRQRAIYMITLVQRERREPLLGRLVVGDGRGGWVAPAAAKALALRPEQVEARVEPTALGAAILAHWKRLGEFTPEIRPLYCQIMPDHLHAILEVTRPMAKPLGNAIGGFKTGCEKIYRELALSAQDKPPAGEAGREPPAGGAIGRLWAEGFQDSILFHAGQLDNMFHYLADNARRLAVKRLFPGLFRVTGELRVSLRLAPQTQDKPSTPIRPPTQTKPPTQIRAGGVACPVPGAPAPEFPARFAALGNRFLLGLPLAQVQVSRRDFGYRRIPKPGGGLKIARLPDGSPIAAFSTPAFDEKRDRLLALAQRGVVLISPCVSDGEREIARLALESRLRLVTLANKGFSPVQKPSGRYFDACADGRLLMLAPINWPFVPGEKTMTREDALVLNRLAQVLAGAGAAKINYHGATIDDVDALARRALI